MAKNSSSKPMRDRRTFLQAALIGGTAIGLAPIYSAGAPVGAPSLDAKPFELDEITIGELQDGMKSGKYTARSLTEKYSERIHEIDKEGPAVNAIIEMNPDALEL